ncbi:hypothetical protein BVI434_1040027 [Burkholderia vietnamiensis]|nr:hypothetical protein BVI434_1040027 [Burkholderia vietnamiensis]
MRYQAALRSDEPKILSSNGSLGQSRYPHAAFDHERPPIGDNTNDDVRRAHVRPDGSPTHGET